jgi:multidrug resistance efflux pump
MNDGARRQLGRLLGIAIVAGAIVTTLWAWSLSYRHPRTDDAAIRANIVGIAPHVGGPIVELRVVDNQAVRAGDLLFTIDARPYEAKLAAAPAALALAEADLARSATRSPPPTRSWRADGEEAYADDYLRRVQPLLGKGYVTADKVEDARTKLRAATASRESAAKDRARAEKLLAEVNDVSAHVEAARASVRSAELDVEYCRVVAPFDAYVTNLNIAVGQYAREGRRCSRWSTTASGG